MKEYYSEYVQINGIQQYFLHYPTESEKVVIYLHGGPGQSELFFSYLTRPTTPCCSFVFYDQRGTGKTQEKNKSKPLEICLETLLEDLKVTVEYIKDRYKDKKIILLGHSWGSILGTEYVKQYSETVSAYIGMGQVVDILAGEKLCYDKLKAPIESKNNKKDRLKYESLSGYPYNLSQNNFIETATKFRKLQARYGFSTNVFSHLKSVIRSPQLTIKDILPYLSCMKNNKNLMDLLLAYNTSDFVEYQCPVFYICGRNDWQVPSVLVEEYFYKIAAIQKELFFIESAGHMTDIDNPVDYNDAIAQICARL